MAEHDVPRGFDDTVRAGLAGLAAGAPVPDDAHLDALESREPPAQRPRHRGRRVLAVAAVLLAVAAIATVVVGSSREGDPRRTELHALGHRVCATTDDPIPVPAPYSDEARLLVPLQQDLGQQLPAGPPTVTAGRDTAELRYDDGTTFRFTTRPGDAAAAAPPPFPTSRAEVDAALTDRARSVTTGMTASGAVITVDGSIDIQADFLASLARNAAELPETMARAIADRQPFPKVDQPFAIGGQTFRRTIEFGDSTTLAGHERTSGQGGIGGELSMLVGAERPETVSEFEADGAYQWLVFVPRGLEVRIDGADGDACTAAVADGLTGGEYWLIRDGDGDEEVTTTTTTKGRPTTFALTHYEG